MTSKHYRLAKKVEFRDVFRRHFRQSDGNGKNER